MRAYHTSKPQRPKTAPYFLPASVDAAPLDGRASHHRLDRLAQPEMGISDDQLHPGEPTRLERAQELGPEGTVLAVADSEAKDLAATIAAHAGGYHDRLGNDPAVNSGLAIGGVHEHIRELLAGQRPLGERLDFGVQVGADPRDLALADPAIRAKGSDQVVDLRVLTPCKYASITTANKP